MVKVRLCLWLSHTIELINKTESNVELFWYWLLVDTSQLVVIGLSSTEVPAMVSEFFVRIFRKYGLHRNERETVLGPADQLVATQLVLASQNQKVTNSMYS